MSDGPVLRIVRGDPSPEEVAALVAVFSVLGTGTSTAPARRTAAWTARDRLVRASHRPAPGGWRASGLPRG